MGVLNSLEKKNFFFRNMRFYIFKKKNSLGDFVTGEAGTHDVVALLIGILVNGFEFGGDGLDLVLGVGVANHLAEPHELHRVTRLAHVLVHVPSTTKGLNITILGFSTHMKI